LVSRPVFTNIEQSVNCVVDCWFSKVYVQCEKCSLSKEKFPFFFEVNFELNFQYERGLSSIHIRRDLHWLPVNHHISRKALHTAEPSYLSELISPYVLARTLRSSNTCLLAIPTGVTSHFASRSFSASAPSTWNSLPLHIRSLENLATFKRQLKSHLFQSAFTV